MTSIARLAAGSLVPLLSFAQVGGGTGNPDRSVSPGFRHSRCEASAFLRTAA
jgi:hypothetical protein